MARIRNRKPEPLRLLAIAGKQPFDQVVDSDEVIEVPDDIYLAHSWSEEVWDLLDVPQRPAKTDEPEVVEGNILEVLDRVNKGEVTAQEALDAEQAKPHPRVTLVASLQDLINDSQEG